LNNEFYEIGDLIDGRYKVIDKLGGGGFGKVVKVVDLTNDEESALKYCSSDEEVDIRRFNREVRIMEGIKHENVMEVVSSNVEHVPPYFTMPVAFHPVTKIIPDLKGNVEKIIEVFEEICKGINAIHISGHTHRDIKPDNVLLFEDGRIAVSDLGLAKYDERDTSVLTRASIYIGTYDYMPPEQMLYAGTRDADHRGDVFQLGKTFYELLTGLRPTVMNPQAVPVSFWYVIQKATRQEPDERYQSVGLLLDAIHDAKRAMDPALNPIGVFGQLLSIAEEKLKANEYDPDNLKKIIQLMYSTDDQEDLIELFHKIPERLIQVYATDLVVDFEPVLEKYFAAIDDHAGSYPFSFAETVARKMMIVFRNTPSAELKKNAVLSVLYAAVRLNRWAAMGDFDNMLRETAEETDAHAIASGLRDKLGLYRRLYDRVPKKELHPALQLVWEACQKLDQEKIDF
jgi:eukaryotic-like serine/threonine-protein kinase